LIKAQEEERSRVARELHDDLSQRMALLSIELEQLNREISKPHSHLQLRIQKLLNVAEDISVEMHHLAYQLHPSKLDHLGLVAAVKSFCQELSERHGIWIDFQYKGFPASLSKDITLCAFRIVQEALHNIVKHSGAGEATVLLEKSDDILRLSVSDAGCGFDTKSEAMTSGLGFVGMKERLRLVGGKLSIGSDPGRGTQIEVSIPLTEQVKQPELTRVAGIV
jgi:signal transduction histidine kinase